MTASLLRRALATSGLLLRRQEEHEEEHELDHEDIDVHLDTLPGFSGTAPVTGIILLTVYWIVAITAAIMFYKRRDIQPCRSRHTTAMVLIFCSISCMNMTYIIGMITDLLCLPAFFLQAAMPFLLLTVYLKRTFVLYFLHRVVAEQRNLVYSTTSTTSQSRALLSSPQFPPQAPLSPPQDEASESTTRIRAEEVYGLGKNGWFMKHRYLLQQKYLVSAMLVTWILACSPVLEYIIGAAPIGAQWGMHECERLKGFHTEHATKQLIVIAIFVMLNLSLAFALSKHGPDSLGIRLELKITALIVLPSSAVAAIVDEYYVPYMVSEYPLREVIVVVYGTALLANAFLLPTWLSYKYKTIRKMSTVSERYAGTFDAMVGNPVVKEAFRRFLQREFSVENLMFFEEVKAFKHRAAQLKKQPNGQESILKLASGIMTKYMLPGAMCEINVGHQLVKQVKQKIENAGSSGETVDETLFDKIHEHIYDLMSRDSFPRFLCSEESIINEGVLEDNTAFQKV